MEAALLQAVVPGGGDGAQGSGDEATRADTLVFPSYSLTDVDGVVHTCTVRTGCFDFDSSQCTYRQPRV